jgi:hypothetical protein
VKNKTNEVLQKLEAIWESAEKASASPFLTDRAKFARIVRDAFACPPKEVSTATFDYAKLDLTPEDKELLAAIGIKI